MSEPMIWWLLAAALNVIAAIGNVVLARRKDALLVQQNALLAKCLPCVGLVTFLARPETGAPDNIREQCARLLPVSGVKVDVHPMPAPNGQVH
jgi:hypothetical protein